MAKLPAIDWLPPTYCEPVVVAFPATEKFPPSVNNPLPKITGRLLTVLKFRVPVIKSIIGFVPVKFKLDARVVVLVTVRLLMVDVARVEAPLTLKLPETTWLPVVVALPLICEFPVTVNSAMVVVAKFEFPLNVTLPLASSDARVVVLVTVKFAMVVVAKVAMLVNCTTPFAIKVFKVDVLVTVRLLIVEVANADMPLTVRFPLTI